jgi:ribosomal protein S17
MLQALVRTGILRGVRGPRGGYELAVERRKLKAGDIVRIEETRPLSKQKRWALVEKVAAGQA